MVHSFALLCGLATKMRVGKRIGFVFESCWKRLGNSLRDTQDIFGEFPRMLNIVEGCHPIFVSMLNILASLKPRRFRARVIGIVLESLVKRFGGFTGRYVDKSTSADV